MLKVAGILFSFFLLQSPFHGHAQTFDGAVSYGTVAEEFGLSVRVDEQGNVITLGGYKDSIDFGNGEVLYEQGTTDLGLFVTKHDAQGDLLWTFNGGTDGEKLFYLDLDGGGNVYVAGSLLGTQTFGDSTFSTQSGESNDNFVLRINANGDFAWARHIRGPDHEHIQGLSVTDQGDIYVSGFFDATFSYEGTTFTNNGQSDVFIMKFTSENAFVWGAAHGGSGIEWPWDIDADAAGNVFVSGSHTAAFQWDGMSLTHAGSNDMFIAKLNASDGSAQWVKALGGSGGDEAFGIQSNAHGSVDEVYVSGYFSGEVQLGAETYTSAGPNDGILLKMDANGDVLWARKFGGNFSDKNIIRPALDVARNVFAGTSSISTMSIGDSTFPNNGSRDFLIAKFDPNGNLKNAISAGGTGNDLLNDIHINGAGKCWITGSFTSSSLDLGGTVLSNTGIAQPDVFIAEITGLADSVLHTTQPMHVSWGSAFPNPAHDRVYVETQGSVSQLHLLDVTGKRVRTVSTYAGHRFISLDLTSVPPGMYFLSAVTQDGTYYEPIKLVKK